jgi:hypothetical protein
VPLQLKPLTQVAAQTPFEHTCAPVHTVVQVPQCEPSARMFVSQPFSG